MTTPRSTTTLRASGPTTTTQSRSTSKRISQAQARPRSPMSPTTVMASTGSWSISSVRIQTSRRRTSCSKSARPIPPAPGQRPPPPVATVVRAGAGTGGADRVELIWPANTIQQEWLEVTVMADSDTGLAVPYTFYFGSLIGDSGRGDSKAVAFTNSTDELGARNTPGSALPVTNAFDYNRDGFVNATDELIAPTMPGMRFINIASAPVLDDAQPQVALPTARLKRCLVPRGQLPPRWPVRQPPQPLSSRIKATHLSTTALQPARPLHSWLLRQMCP